VDQSAGRASVARIQLTGLAPFRLGPITVDPLLRQLRHDDRRSEVLEPRVMQVLIALARTDGAIVTRDALIDTCWDGRIVGEDAIIRTISRLRRSAGGIGQGIFRIETITKTGYRLVREGHEDGAPIAADLSPPLESSRAALSRRRVIATVALGVLLVLGAAATLLLWSRMDGIAGARTLMVQPLTAAAGDHDAQLLRQSLSNDLTRVVVGNDTALSFVNPGDAAAVRARPDFLVSGEAQSNAGGLNAVVRLVDNRNAVILWSRAFSGKTAETEALRRRMAIRVGEVLICALGARAKRPADIDLATLRLFLAGCENWHTDWHAARGFLRQVVERRPDFAQARAMYARAITLNTGPLEHLTPDATKRLLVEAELEARKAIAQEPHAGSAYVALASALYSAKGWAGPQGTATWVKRVAILDQGLAADPDSFDVRTALGTQVQKIGLARQALGHYERAAAVDPFAPVAATNLADADAFVGKLPEANKILAQAQDYWPDEFYTGWARFEIAARAGNPEDALAMLDDPHRNPGYRPAHAEVWHKFVEARADPASARVKAARAAILAAVLAADIQAKVDFIQHLVQLGKLDDAFDLAANLPMISNQWGHVWFRDFMRPFRADARFLEFARRQGLYAIWVQSNRWPDYCSDEQLHYRCH